MDPTILDFMNDHSGFFKRLIVICRPANLDYGADHSGNPSCAVPTMNAALERKNPETRMIATRGRGSYQCCRAIVGRTTAKPNAAIRVGRPSPEPETPKQRREGLSTSFPSIERNPHGLSAPHSSRNPKRYAGRQPVQILSPHPRTQTYRTPNRQKC